MNTLKTKLVECGKPGLSGATVRIMKKQNPRWRKKPFTSSLNIFTEACCTKGLDRAE
jgi:hypothetical protein